MYRQFIAIYYFDFFKLNTCKIKTKTGLEYSFKRIRNTKMTYAKLAKAKPRCILTENFNVILSVN